MNTEQKQCLLKYLRFYSGNIDGEWGPQSQAAAEAFQRVHNLTVDGIIGPKTEAQLKEAVSNDEFAPDQKKEEANIEPGTETEEANTSEPEESTGTFWDEIQYFTRAEFGCHCGGRYCNGFPVEPSEKLVRTLDELRKRLKRPITVTSGIRCARWNADPQVKGVSNSQHILGTAADIQVSGVLPSKVATYAEALLTDTGGIGRYESFTHIDVRQQKARWTG